MQYLENIHITKLQNHTKLQPPLNYQKTGINTTAKLKGPKIWDDQIWKKGALFSVVMFHNQTKVTNIKSDSQMYHHFSGKARHFWGHL